MLDDKDIGEAFHLFVRIAEAIEALNTSIDLSLDEVLYHVTFMTPVRVMLMDKSTPMAAVTATVSVEAERLILHCKMLFPVIGGPVKSSMQLVATPHNIGGAVEVKAP